MLARLLPHLLLSLTLLTAACKKNEIEPKPSLEGRWRLLKVYQRSYSATNTLVYSNDQIVPSVKADLFIEQGMMSSPAHHLFPEPDPGTYAYTRQGNILNYKMSSAFYMHYPYTSTIIELTAQHLELRSDHTFSGSTGKHVFGSTYKRMP